MLAESDQYWYCYRKIPNRPNSIGGKLQFLWRY